MASNPLSHVLLQKRLQRSKQPLALGCGACLVVLSATSFIPQLEPLRLLGLYGSLHSALLFALASSQDIPDPKLAKERLKRGELAKLGLSALGCALLSEAVSGQQGPLPKLAQLFLLPLTASLGALSGTVRSPLCVYLVLHFAMACVRPSENFADQGWQSCALTLLFNCVILGAVHLHTSELLELQKVVDETVSMLEQMASVMCDGFCCLQSNGNIVMINRGLAGLLSDDVEGAMMEWIGLPFETLQFKAFQSEDESGRVEPGPRRLKLRKKGGGALDVETLTLRLSLPQEALTLILGDRLDNFSQSEPIFLRTMRTRQSAMDGAAESLHLGSVLDAAPSVRRPGSLSDLGAARALSELGADHDSSFGLRSNCGSYVSSVPPTPISLGISRRNSNNSGFSAFSRRSSEGLPMRTASSETQSVISSAASDTPANFTNRRLELMRDKLMSLNQDSTSVIMELDVPVWQSEVSSLCGPSSQARVRLRSKQAGGRREFDGESMVSGSFVSEACTEEGEDSEDEVEEVVQTEVIGAQPSAEGMMRVQIGFTSQILAEHKQQLRSMCDELTSVRRDMERRGGVQAEQTEILKSFRKIVTRKANEVSEEGSPNVIVLIVEGRAAVRSELEKQCRILGFPWQSFADVMSASEYIDESGSNPANVQGGLQRPKWSNAQWASKPAAGAGDEGAAVGASAASAAAPPAEVTLRRFEATARIILLSATLLEGMPVDWCDSAFITLTSSQDEVEYMESILPSRLGDDRMRERLRAWGVHEALQHPISLEQLRTLARQGLERQFGDDYLLVQHLGSGGTSQGYDTRRLRDGESFALKEINISRLLRRRYGQSDLEMVWKEVEILRALSWPTVLYLVDAWWGDGAKVLYLLLPTYAGGPLAKQVADAAADAKPLGLDRVADWYAQTLHATSYLHWCGVVHRDIKTENLLLDTAGRKLCLADMGTAELLPGPGPHPANGAWLKASVTTPKITPPEVFSSSLFCPASDIWAVAATFYEVAMRKPLLEIDLVEFQGVFEVDPQKLDERGMNMTLALQHALHAGADACANGSGTMSASGLCASIAQDIGEMLNQDATLRPLAAALVRQPHCMEQVEKLLRGPGWHTAESERHFRHFEQIIEESLQATECTDKLALLPSIDAGGRHGDPS